MNEINFKYKNQSYTTTAQELFKYFGCNCEPSLFQYQNYRYSLYPVFRQNSIYFCINLVLRELEKSPEYTIEEKMVMINPIETYEQISPYFSDYNQAVTYFNNLTKIYFNKIILPPVKPIEYLYVQ